MWGAPNMYGMTPVDEQTVYAEMVADVDYMDPVGKEESQYLETIKHYYDQATKFVDQSSDAQQNAALNIDNLLQKVTSALSIWTTPDGIALLAELNKQNKISSFNEIAASLRTTYQNITGILLPFPGIIDLPFEAIDWAITQTEWLQWEGVQGFWKGDRIAGRYALGAQQILNYFRLQLQQMIPGNPTPPTGAPSEPGTVLPPLDPGTPPTGTTSNKNILLIGAVGLALIFFLSKRK